MNPNTLAAQRRFIMNTNKLTEEEINQIREQVIKTEKTHNIGNERDNEATENDNNGEDALEPQKDGESALAWETPQVTEETKQEQEKLKTMIEAIKLKMDENNTTIEKIRRP